MPILTILQIIAGAVSFPVLYIFIQIIRGKRPFQGAPIPTLLIPATYAFLLCAATYAYGQFFQTAVLIDASPFSEAPDQLNSLASVFLLKVYITQAALFIFFCAIFLIKPRIPLLTRKPTHAGRIFTLLTLLLFIYLQKHQSLPAITAPLEPDLRALAITGLEFLQRWFYTTLAATFLTSLIFLIQPHEKRQTP